MGQIHYQVETPGQAAFPNESTPADKHDWDKMIAKWVGRKRDLTEIEETMQPDMKLKRPDGLIFDSHESSTENLCNTCSPRTSDDVDSL